MDVGEHSTLRDGDTAQELVEFLVVPDGELDVARYDAGALVVLGGVSGELEKFGGEVLEDGGEVDGRPRADAPGEASATKVPCHAPYGELESGLGTPGCVLASLLAALLSCWHLELVLVLDFASSVWLINLSNRLVL